MCRYMPIIDANRIDEILDRGTIVTILPTKKEFKEKLLSGKKLRFYWGFDATSTTLHLSHAKNFILLEKFRKLGHEVIVLFGDFTARIGDPSEQSTTRKQLTRDEVLHNVKIWKKLVEPLMDFNDTENPPKIMYNHEWLSKLTLEDVVELSSHLTVQQMIERDMFQKRLSEGKPIHLHEFLYPLMQGYDSVAMEVDVEMCGTDQIFNALTGRTLLKKLKDKDKMVVAVTLMENPKTGELMSKSRGTGVFLDVSANEMYGQVMAQPDEMTDILFTHLTSLPKTEINNIITTGPKEAKMHLALLVTEIFHGKENALHAQTVWNQSFSEKKIPEDIPEIIAITDSLLSEILVKNKLLSSKGEFRRLVDEGGIKILTEESEEKITDFQYVFSEEIILKIGKKKFVKILTK